MSEGKTKSVFIIPPKWYCLNPPSFMIPTVSYLRNIGCDTRMLDFNIDFYSYILKEDYLKNSLIQAEKQLPELFDYLKKHYQKGKSQEDYSDDFKWRVLRYNKIKKFIGEQKENVKKAIEKLSYSIKVMKDKDLYYNPSEFTAAMNNIEFCLEIACLPFYPSQIQIKNYTDPDFKLDFNFMVKRAKSKNLFTEFFQNNLNKVNDLNPDIICISIDAVSQIAASCTLAALLKEKSTAKIAFLGNYYSRITDTIKKYPEFFDIFCDYIVPDELEIPTLPKLFEHLEGKIPVEEVPNILYKKDNMVKENQSCPSIKLSERPVWDLSDFDLSLYPTPEIVLPQLSSRGCYWGKCSFCDHYFGQKTDIKPVSQFVDELETINKKYGIKHFELIDECISPNYLLAMSKEILKRNLDIYFFNYARLETGFNEEVLSTAYKAGCRMLLWGFESASEKVMKDINKGIDLDKREDILRLARKIGIWNFAFLFFGFPTETQSDAIETIEYLKNHKDIISSYGRSVFTLGKHSYIIKNPEKFSITRIYSDVEEFSSKLHFETSIGMNEKQMNEISQRCLNECAEAYNNPIWMYLIYREILFLYICKYGADKVEKMYVETSSNNISDVD